MNRRALLRSLFFLPLAPLAAKLAAKLASNAFTVMRRSGKSSMTLLDVARRYEPGLLPMVEALSHKNRLLEDMVWYEGDLETGHKIWHGSKLPEVTHRKVWP